MYSLLQDRRIDLVSLWVADVAVCGPPLAVSPWHQSSWRSRRCPKIAFLSVFLFFLASPANNVATRVPSTLHQQPPVSTVIQPIRLRGHFTKAVRVAQQALRIVLPRTVDVSYCRDDEEPHVDPHYLKHLSSNMGTVHCSRTRGHQRKMKVDLPERGNASI